MEQVGAQPPCNLWAAQSLQREDEGGVWEGEKGGGRSHLTSVLKEASSSELDSSASGGFLISLGSFSGLTFSALAPPLSLAGFLSEKEEDEVRGEVLGALLDPLELLFFCFLALGLGESAAAGRLLEDLGGGGGGGPPLGDMLSSLVSFRAILGSLNAALGGGALSSLGGRPSPSFRAASLALLACSRSGSLQAPLLSESLRGRSRCSLVVLWALQALPLSLLASCNAGQEGDTVKWHLGAALLRLPRPLQSIIHLIQTQLEKIFHKAKK